MGTQQSMKLQINQKIGCLTLEGDLSIDQAEEFKQILLDVLPKLERLNLIFEKVTQIDLSFIQLFLSLQQSLTSSQASVQVEGEAEILWLLLEKYGFNSELFQNKGGTR